MDFLDLPSNKFRNKVICDFHFKENSFMNYKRERLTKTIAVPTIYIEPDTRVELDLLEKPTDWVEENKRRAATTTYKQPGDINMHEQTNSASNDEESPLAEPVRKKAKTDPAPVVRILNGSGSMRILCPSAVKKQLPTAKQSSPLLVKLAPENFTIRKVVKSEAAANPIIPKQQIIETIATEEEDIVTLEPQTTSQPTASVMKPESDVSEDLKPVLEESLRQIAEIKEMLNKKQADVPLPSSRKSSEDNISQSQFNKVQLFNGIKRYLSPSITALLRMELFQSPGREYKKDEKIICQELLQLGDKTYSFLHDEWRLRLPAQSEVQQWLDDKAIEEDDDAS